MGTLKDIVDLAKDLESRVKDRRDMDIVHQIQALAFSFQSSYTDVVERDVELVKKNAELEKQLAEANAEDCFIDHGVEFRKGKRTRNRWLPFCPKCHLPAEGTVSMGNSPMASCTSQCGWSSYLPMDLDQLVNRANTTPA